MTSMPRSRNEVGNDQEEDDFADFGGFEAAEPIVDLPSLQAQPADSPWALFSSGNASGRPDLLCAQNRFPTYLDPSDISGASAEASNNGTDSISIPHQPHEDLFNQIDLNQARIAENVLDGTLLVPAGQNFHQNLGLANGHLPDIGLGINEGRLFNQAEDASQPQARQIIEAPPPLEFPVEIPIENVNLLLPTGRRRSQNAEEAERLVEDVPVVNRPQEAPNNDADLPNILVEQINSLPERNRLLEEELTRCQEQLTNQKARFEEVQSQYNEEIENIKKAGHDALSVVVEQYKEQSRTIVLEQQETAQRNLLEALNTQMRAFQDLLQTERELNERQRESDRQELARRIETALEESRQRQQVRFDSFLVEEQEKHKASIAKAIEEKSQENKEVIKQTIDQEQEKLKTRVEELLVECCEKLSEERQTQEVALKSFREEQLRLAQEQMSDQVMQERERGRSALREALEQSRLDMQTYIQEQRQSDSRVRQRHLLSLDLFLESSRQQISLLMQSERPEPTSLPEDKKTEDS